MFSEFEKLELRLKEVLAVTQNDKIKKGILKMLDILDDVLVKKTKSVYYRDVSPLDVCISTVSQIRAISKAPEHVELVKQSILRNGKVNKALLLAQASSPGAYPYEVLNGIHRDTVTTDLIHAGNLPEDFDYPSVVIPASEYGVIHAVLPIIQGILNDHEPAKSNNTNDIQKVMESIVKTLNYNLNKEEDYDILISLCESLFQNITTTSLKTNLTRLKNKTNAARSDVLCETPDEFIKLFLTAHDGQAHDKKFNLCDFTIKPIKYTNCKVDFASVKGSVLDQLVPREAIFTYDNPNKKVVHVFACQDNKGDSQTTLKSREAYFKRLYKLWQVFDRIEPHLVAISPQNKASFEARIGGTIIMVRAEHAALSSSWVTITRQEILQQFKDKESGSALLCYKQDWIARPVLQAFLKAVTG